GRSGRQSPSTRITSSGIRTATRATTYARTGCCPSGQRRAPARSVTACAALAAARKGVAQAEPGSAGGGGCGPGAERDELLAGPVAAARDEGDAPSDELVAQP